MACSLHEVPFNDHITLIFFFLVSWSVGVPAVQPSHKILKTDNMVNAGSGVRASE